jgi:hypothetical protein
MADMVSIAEKMTAPALLARQRMVAATDYLMLGSAIDTLRQRHDAIIAERDEAMSKAGYSAS